MTVLKAGWSPQQIAGRMRHEGGLRRVCHETIYRYVYSPEGQAQELGRYLPERRRKRKARYARKPRSLVFPERCMIRNPRVHALMEWTLATPGGMLWCPTRRLRE